MKQVEEKTITLRSDSERSPLPAIIRVLDSPSAPKQFSLVSGSCSIGAGKDVDIVVEDRAMSRRHVELSLVPEGVVVCDLGSRNGTHYLGQRVDRATLQLGSRLRLGRTNISVELDETSLFISNAPEATRYADLHGSSPQMRRLFAALGRLEGSLANVLIYGESGTGKELIARAIHANSSVSNGPFIAVNCGALDRGLARSELFGHQRGAFTGAVEARVGLIEAASGGTLFLDEIGELPLDIQPMLLRALETRSVVRVGENTERKVSIRLVCATNRDLLEEVNAARFREDLYYRLVVVKLCVPPLRERPEDVEILAKHFGKGLGIPTLPLDAIAELRAHSWPGNARELRNAIECFGALGAVPSSDVVAAPELIATMRRTLDVTRPYAEQKEELLRVFLKVYVQMLLQHTHGNLSEAARLSGIERSYFGKVARRIQGAES